jgi:hypothetical protein
VAEQIMTTMRAVPRSINRMPVILAIHWQRGSRPRTTAAGICALSFQHAANAELTLEHAAVTESVSRAGTRHVSVTVGPSGRIA